MVMRVDGGVKTLLGAPDLKFKYDATIRKELQIAVHSSQSDSRQPFAHHIVDFIGGRMAGNFPEFLENDLPLGGQSHVG